jgi:hypothetical protein
MLRILATVALLVSAPILHLSPSAASYQDLSAVMQHNRTCSISALVPIVITS